MNLITAFWCVLLLIVSADTVFAATPNTPDGSTIIKRSQTSTPQAANKLTRASKPAVKRRQEGPEQATTIAAAHVVQTSQYILSGDSQGRVTLKNAVTGAVIRTFQMEAGRQVRQVFLLDKGATVGASQLDHTVFWNVATGSQTGRVNEQAYGFAHTQTCFFTQSPNDDTINLYAYPALNMIGQLSAGTPQSGPGAFLFSPDDHYLAVLHDSCRPEADGAYPNGTRFLHSTTYTRMYDLQTMQEIASFSKYFIAELTGTFSTDSRFFNLTNTLILSRARDYPAAFQFEMATQLLTKVPFSFQMRNSSLFFP